MKSLYSLLFCLCNLLAIFICSAEAKPISCAFTSSWCASQCHMVEPDISQYSQKLSSWVNQRWTNMYGNKLPGVVVLHFTVNKDGTIQDIHVSKSCGNQKADNYAVKLVQDFPKVPLPDNCNACTSIELTVLGCTNQVGKKSGQQLHQSDQYTVEMDALQKKLDRLVVLKPHEAVLVIVVVRKKDRSISGIRIVKSNVGAEKERKIVSIIRRFDKKMPFDDYFSYMPEISLIFPFHGSEASKTCDCLLCYRSRRENQSGNEHRAKLPEQKFDKKLNVTGLEATEFPGVYKLQSGNSNNRLINGLDPSIIILPGR